MSTASNRLETLREEVAALDKALIQTLSRRIALSAEAVKFKTSTADITDPGMPGRVMQRAKDWGARAQVPDALVNRIFSAILEHSIAQQLALFGSGAAKPFCESSESDQRRGA